MVSGSVGQKTLLSICESPRTMIVPRRKDKIIPSQSKSKSVHALIHKRVLETKNWCHQSINLTLCGTSRLQGLVNKCVKALLKENKMATSSFLNCLHLKCRLEKTKLIEQSTEYILFYPIFRKALPSSNCGFRKLVSYNFNFNSFIRHFVFRKERVLEPNDAQRVRRKRFIVLNQNFDRECEWIQPVNVSEYIRE